MTRVPERIVEADGRVNVGWWSAPIADPNIEDAPVRHRLERWRGSLVERGYRRWRLKSWQYVSVVSPRTLFACAVVDAGYVGNAFAYAVDRASGAMEQASALLPLGLGVEVARSSVSGTTAFAQPGFGRITIEAREGRRLVAMELRSGATARYVIHDAGSDPHPVAVVEESEPGRYLYTHKCYGLAAEGTLSWGTIRDDVAREEGHAGLDHNRGFRPRETWWNWAAAGGTARGGARVGFNLTAHRRWDEADHGREDAGDCALWIDGACVKIPRVRFSYSPSDRMQPWSIADDEGLVALSFEPLGERHEDIELGLIASRFHQPYGRFSGRLCTREGREVELDDVFGVTEQHYARW